VDKSPLGSLQEKKNRRTQISDRRSSRVTSTTAWLSGADVDAGGRAVLVGFIAEGT